MIPYYYVKDSGDNMCDSVSVPLLFGESVYLKFNFKVKLKVYAECIRTLYWLITKEIEWLKSILIAKIESVPAKKSLILFEAAYRYHLSEVGWGQNILNSIQIKGSIFFFELQQRI